MVNVLVIEDSQVERLYPVTIGRPAYAITCGCLRLYDWLTRLNANVNSLVRSHLSMIQELDYPGFAKSFTESPVTIVLSARLVPSRDNFRRLQKLIDDVARQFPDQPQIARDEQHNVVVAVMATGDVIGSKLGEMNSKVNKSAAEARELDVPFDALCLPHDLIRYNQKCFLDNIEFLLTTREYQEIRPGLFSAGEHSISDNVVVDTSDGPVVVDANARVGPYSYISGPVYIGPNCKVNEHSSIKDFVCLTNTVKAGGEIEASIIEPYSNKQHHGFLGHAYLGSWINLGAGSCNSDLKNTYGEVKMDYGATGMQFLGCLIGDYSKTAINTSVFTGKLVGVCSNLYGFVTSSVPSFVNYARSFGEMTVQPVEVMQITQQRMFARRNVEQRSCDIQLLADMFELTMADRPADLSTNSPSL